MASLDLGDPAATESLTTALIDQSLTQLMIDVFHKGNELGQNLLERQLAQEKVNEGLRQLARLQADKNTLRLVGQSGTFPAPEVQLQIAGLAFDSAAASVERAGEYFFLL